MDHSYKFVYINKLTPHTSTYIYLLISISFQSLENAYVFFL